MLDFIASIHPTLSGALGFLLGALVGHRITLSQHRRQEFNAIAGPLREKLIAARGISHWPVYVLSDIEIDRLDPYLGRFGRRSLRRAVEGHRASYKANSHTSDLGHSKLLDPAAVGATLAPILRIVRAR